MFGSILDFIKPYLAKTITAIVFTALGAILLKWGIDQSTLYNIILGIISILLGGTATVAAHNAPKPPTLGAVIAKRINGGS